MEYVNFLAKNKLERKFLQYILFKSLTRRALI